MGYRPLSLGFCNSTVWITSEKNCTAPEPLKNLFLALLRKGGEPEGFTTYAELYANSSERLKNSGSSSNFNNTTPV